MKPSIVATGVALILCGALSGCGVSSSSPSYGDVGGTPTPIPIAIATSAPASDAHAFSSDFHAALTEEEAGVSAMSGVNLSAGHGATTIPAVQSARAHFENAVKLDARPHVSPFGDVGGRTLDAFVDQAAMSNSLLGDYPDGPVQADYNKIMADDQKLLGIQGEMQNHGLY